MTEGQRKLTRAVKDCKLKAPWNLLPQVIPYNQAKHEYALRTGTMPTTTKLYQPILQAAALYVGTGYTESSDYFFRMVQRQRQKDFEIILEAGMPDGTSFLVVARSDSLQISSVETDGSRSPVLPFLDMSTAALTYIILALMPHILEIDKKEGGSMIASALTELGPEMDMYVINPWATKNDIPEVASDAAYYLDAVLTVLEKKMTLDCCENGSAVPHEVDDSYFRVSDALTGSLLCENLNPWGPSVVKTNGNKKKFANAKVTVAEAKQQYSVFSAHRSWTAQERLLIPEFPDDEPVMPETLQIAKRICDTRNDKNPICNLMWRGITSYGKSTGVEQLACILQVPLLRMTCHPDMETQDFKSQFVPDSSTEGILLDMQNVVAGDGTAPSKPMPPHFEDAMARLSAMDPDSRNALLDAKAFFDIALMDPDTAAADLLGSPVKMEAEDLVWLYSEVCTAIRTAPLEAKLAAFESANKQEPKDNKPAFVHIVSDYVKAMVNGYLVEIQEASRIRTSGVMVGLNEFNRPGARIPLMNGYTARRHKDALCIITDNVGYSSCRPIDPSVIRRQGMILDSYELTKEELLDRVKRNTGVTDKSLLETAYKLWKCVKDFCEQNSITEGCVSATELECLVQAVKYDGMDSFDSNLASCVISKATSSIDDQRDIRTACQTLIAGF